MPGDAFLRGERVTLRTVERDDAAFVRRSRNDPDIRVPFGTSQPQNEAQMGEHVEDTVEDQQNVSLLVCLDDEPIGGVNANKVYYTRPPISYWLLPEYRGEGYGSEAVSLFVDYLFSTFECHGLHAFVYHTNDASRALLESRGFSEEGRLREHRFRDGEYVDVVYYGLLREEWADARN